MQTFRIVIVRTRHDRFFFAFFDIDIANIDVDVDVDGALVASE